jgi:hypothetical protein
MSPLTGSSFSVTDGSISGMCCGRNARIETISVIWNWRALGLKSL